MDVTVKCPVCGKENTRTYQTMEWGYICEDYYYCDNCSYFEHQCYSEWINGVVEGRFKGYEAKVQELNLTVYPEDVVSQIY